MINHIYLGKSKWVFKTFFPLYLSCLLNRHIPMLKKTSSFDVKIDKKTNSIAACPLFSPWREGNHCRESRGNQRRDSIEDKNL